MIMIVMKSKNMSLIGLVSVPHYPKLHQNVVEKNRKKQSTALKKGQMML